ncbi:hypothetical protein [Chamaesiphon sp.]|uniref:hypothetical protein n=1 Tax=Chamaesiphon sp. TaxID=2814140 RepID=UPI0035935D3B
MAAVLNGYYDIPTGSNFTPHHTNTTSLIMATDYIIFIHGVNTRKKDFFEKQAMNMFAQIKKNVNSDLRNLKPVILFWGDIAEKSIDFLLYGLDKSPTWEEFRFREFREQQVINFVGDAVLYLSRNVSVQMINQMTVQALDHMELTLDQLKSMSPKDGDRLHLVTHSWGAVILFDIMFAARWEDETLDESIRQSVNNIRTGFFGVGNSDIKNCGIPIASIHTMGSPISLFNLLNASGAKSFNLTPKLKDLLSSLHIETGKPLPWCNYAHPGDPIAYPLKGVMDLSLGEARDFVKINDIVTNTFSLIPKESLLHILRGGDAHSSYWNERSVIKNIGDVIKDVNRLG